VTSEGLTANGYTTIWAGRALLAGVESLCPVTVAPAHPMAARANNP
jgi:hypothetical protein